MSFGFSVGDFMGAAQLAFNLWKYCYKVARDAPHEFKLLVSEISTLSQAIRFLEEETKNPESILMRSGEDRIRMINEMIDRVVVTLKELQKITEKYEKLGDLSRGRMKQAWSKFKWSVDASDLDGLRNKLVYHNGVISLLLISCGNSSLQRIEEANLRLERRFSEIEGFIHKFGTQSSSTTPQLSAVDTKIPKLSLMGLNTALMKEAEDGHRKWSAIGVEEWIQAGRWWLMKAQMDLSERSVGNKISKQGYLNLIKASWILIDVIAKHPQLNLLDSVVSSEVVQLAETIKTELGYIDTQGLLKPDFKDLLACDLQIWESQSKVKLSVPLSSSQASSQLWMASEEDVLFQRFGHYKSNQNATPVPCIVLLMIKKTDRKARIVLANQSWNTLVEFKAGKINPYPLEGNVHIDREIIELGTSLSARHLCTVWEAIAQLLLHTLTDDCWEEVLGSFMLLVAVKQGYCDVFETILRVEQDPDLLPSGPGVTVVERLAFATKNLALKILGQGKSEEAKQLESAEKFVPLYPWAGSMGYHTVTAVLLAGVNVIVSEMDAEWWYSLHNVAGTGNMSVLKWLLADPNINLNAKSAVDPLTPLYVAARAGHETTVEKLLKVGAHIEDSAGTALQAAAGGGHTTIVDTLLEAGADINAKVGGCTALQAAAAGGHTTIVGTLLKAGADINLAPSTKPGYTALRAAVGGGHEDVIEMLLRAGAEINIDLTEYSLKYEMATAYKTSDLATIEKILMMNPDVNEVDEDMCRDTVFQVAAGKGQQSIVEKLLEAGADINSKATLFCGRTALQAASGGGHEAIVELLLKKGADINAEAGKECGRTALQAAAGGGHEAIVEILLKAAADVNAKASDAWGRTALQAAAGGGHRAVVDKLLEAGADINAEAGEDYGTTALQAAAGGGHQEIVDKLLEAGADINAEAGEDSGRTALQAAAGGGHQAIVDKLLEAGADINAEAGKKWGGTALQAAAEGGHQAIVDKLLPILPHHKPYLGLPH